MTLPDGPAMATPRYITHVNAFRTKLAAVPAHAFVAEREQLFDPGTPTGLILLDLSAMLGTDYPATTPAMLCRYARIRPGETLETAFEASGTVFFVIAGHGQSRLGDTMITWRAGDAFVLPGGVAARHGAGAEGAMLYCADDEPALRFYGARPSTGVRPVHYAADEIEAEFAAVYGREADGDEAGKAVFLTSETGSDYGTVTPSMVAVINSLEAGGHQRAHRHNAAAVTLALAGQHVSAMIDGERIDWVPHLVMVTPPTAVHSIDNRGDDAMRALVVQDSGLFFYLRATGFSFA